MGSTIEIRLGDKFKPTIAGSGNLQIEIVKLGVDVSFLATGDQVQNPDQIRVLPISAFAEWLKVTKAVRVK